jgi:hypothetical protein
MLRLVVILRFLFVLFGTLFACADSDALVLKLAPSDFFQSPLAHAPDYQPSTRDLCRENGWLNYDTLSGYLVAAKGGDEFVDVYRAFGDDARAQGFSWTTKDPRTVSNFRDAAGLPSGGASGANNSADFLIQGRARASDIIESRSALPLDGNRGGLPELIINPNNVDITDFSVLNP